MNQMVNNLISSGVLKTPHIIDAFLAIDRKDFIPNDVKNNAYSDTPLPIGHGQTISQPTTIAFMLEELSPNKGNHILDVGCGSCFVTALLSHIVSHDESGHELPHDKCGKVIGIEIIPELAKFGTFNLSKYNFIKRKITEVHCLNATKGFEKYAPYDKIIAAASTSSIPENWKKQLKIGGIILSPIDSSIVKLEKKDENSFYKEKYEGFVFVPYIE